MVGRISATSKQFASPQASFAVGRVEEGEV